MSDADRALVQAIRDELAAIDPVRACDRSAESAGLGSALSTRDPSVARLAVRLGRETVEGVRLLSGRRRTKHVRLHEGDGTVPAWDWERAPEHCRAAWLRGLFLARGSLSLAANRPHLEFVVGPDDAPVLAARLAELGLPAGWRLRRGRGVVTWKSLETIGHFLRLAGAGAALLELESRAVSRALRGTLNRVLNAEAANLERAVAASARQLAAIDALAADGRLAAQPYAVRLVAAARREIPEATLAELAERAGVHRSAVQRALSRLERLADGAG